MPETNFFWDPLSDNILQERDETGAVTAEYTTEPGLYGSLFSQNRGDVESQYHFDAHGSTLALTGNAQQVTDTYAYTTFGQVDERTGSTVNPFEYIGRNGYYRDDVTGDCFVRRRPLAADLGLWLTTDPVPPLVRALHAYTYVANNPASFADPSGLELVHEPIGTEGCEEKELDEIKAALNKACTFATDARGARCLPPDLKDCLAKICDGRVLTKCIKECDRTKGHHETCARVRVTKDKKSFSDPEGDTRCKSSVPEGATPVIELCYTIKTAPGTGLSNPKKCVGAPENVMQVVFHELMHCCGSMHKLDTRNRPIVEGDLVFGCMQRCFGSRQGNADDCTCC